MMGAAPPALLGHLNILTGILAYLPKSTLAIWLRASHLFFELAGLKLYRRIDLDGDNFNDVPRGLK